MGFLELRRAKGAGGGDPQDKKEMLIEYYKKFTIPCASFVFGLMGIPLGIRKTRGGKSYGFIISLIVILIYYLLLLTAETMAKGTAVMPMIAMWVPNLVMLLLGVVLIRAAAQEKIPGLFMMFSRAITRCRLALAAFLRHRR